MDGELVAVVVFVAGMAFMVGWACGVAVCSRGGREGAMALPGVWLAVVLVCAVALALGGER